MTRTSCGRISHPLCRLWAGWAERWSLRVSPSPSHAPVPLREPLGQAVLSPQERLFCRTCHALVTDLDQAMVMGESHEHTFFNPQGQLFRIGCFRVAVGCGVVGVASAEFSWFAGYLWKIALCRGCHHHLGWQFLDAEGSDSFWGLILDRLVAKESP